MHMVLYGTKGHTLIIYAVILQEHTLVMEIILF